jgi:hypothetical protein
LFKDPRVIIVCVAGVVAGFVLAALIFGRPWHLPPNWGISRPGSRSSWAGLRPGSSCASYGSSSRSSMRTASGAASATSRGGRGDIVGVQPGAVIDSFKNDKRFIVLEDGELAELPDEGWATLPDDNR